MYSALLSLPVSDDSVNAHEAGPSSKDAHFSPRGWLFTKAVMSLRRPFHV